MKKYIKVIVSTIFIMPLFGFTSFSKKIEVPGGDIQGSETEDGIVLRLDSTAKDVLIESGQKIRFSIGFSSGNEIISTLNLPIDFSPKKFTFKHDKYGFTGDITLMNLSFYHVNLAGGEEPPEKYGQFEYGTISLYEPVGGVLP